MPAEPTEPAGHEPATQRRCPVCWTPFAPNPSTNPHPRRYCSAACRMEDWRRRREHEQTRILLDTALERIRAANAADTERREALRQRHTLDERRSTMNPD
jgi:hypothetical protein